MQDPSFDQLAALIRAKCGFNDRKRIDRGTLLEKDLGITGDDGCELLEAVETRFGVTFTRESFGLEENEFLFGPEASLGDFVTLFRMWRGRAKYRAFTAGELFDVTMKELDKQRRG